MVKFLTYTGILLYFLAIAGVIFCGGRVYEYAQGVAASQEKCIPEAQVDGVIQQRLMEMGE